MRTLFAFVTLLVTPFAIAAEAKPAPVDPLSSETLFRVFGSLGLIIVAIFVLVWLLRRSGNLVRGRSGKMQVVDVLSLGQRERLVLVSVGEEQILLGVAPGRVQAVHTIDAPYYHPTTSASGGSFAELLNRASKSEAAKSGQERVDE